MEASPARTLAGTQKRPAFAFDSTLGLESVLLLTGLHRLPRILLQLTLPPERAARDCTQECPGCKQGARVECKLQAFYVRRHTALGHLGTVTTPTPQRLFLLRFGAGSGELSPELLCAPLPFAQRQALKQRATSFAAPCSCFWVGRFFSVWACPPQHRTVSIPGL